jgi:hypothetical protein
MAKLSCDWQRMAISTATIANRIPHFSKTPAQPVWTHTLNPFAKQRRMVDPPEVTLAKLHAWAARAGNNVS